MDAARAPLIWCPRAAARVSRARSARRVAVVALAAAAAAVAALAAASGAGLLPGPGIADTAEPDDGASVGVAIAPDDMPAVGGDAGGKKHYVVEASDSPDVGP